MVRLKCETGSLSPKLQGNPGRGKLTSVKDWVAGRIAVRPDLTIDELTAELSHRDPKTAAIYTKRVDRARLAAQAALRVQEVAAAKGVSRTGNRGTLDDVTTSTATEN